MAMERAIDDPVTNAMMKAANNADAEVVATAAATILAQCCVMGTETIDQAYAEMERHVDDIKRQITLNHNMPKFPRSS